MESLLNPITCVLEEIHRSMPSDAKSSTLMVLKDCRDVYALLPLRPNQKDGIDRFGKYRIFPSSTNDCRLYCMDEASNRCGYLEVIITTPNKTDDFDMQMYEASIRIVPENDAEAGDEIGHLYFAERMCTLPQLKRIEEVLDASYQSDDIMAGYTLLRKYHPSIRTEKPTKLLQALMTLSAHMKKL